jgi:hypothetical protein
VSAGANEQDGRLRRRCDCGANREDYFVTPAVRESDDEHSRVRSGFDDALLTRRNQQRLGDDPDDLLNEQGGARKQPAGVAPPQAAPVSAAS